MTRHRIALIGLGMAVTPHAKSLLDLQHRVAVALAVSPNAQRRESFAAHYPWPTADSIAPVIADRSITCAAVLTPPNTHLEVAGPLAAAGKNILLEKPVEVSTARAEELVAVCRRAGVTLGVVLQHRFKPAAERLAEIVRTNELGNIVNCSTTIRLWRPQSYYDEPGRGSRSRDGGGVLLTQGIHTLDLMLSLAGPVAEVLAYTQTSPVHHMETEDMVCAAVRFRNGALGVIDATTAAYPGAPERIELIGTKGTAMLAGTALQVKLHDGRRQDIEADSSLGGAGADPMAFPHDYHLELWRNFLHAVETGQSPRISGSEALKVHRLIDALLEAGETGRKVQIAA